MMNKLSRMLLAPLVLGLAMCGLGRANADTTSSAQSSTVAEDLKNLNDLLARTGTSQSVTKIDDMLIPTERLVAYRNGLQEQAKAGSLGTRSSQYPFAFKWPNGEVYYEYDANVTPSMKSAFVEACDEWSTWANVKFLPATSGYRLHVQDSDFNQSYIGMIGETDVSPDGAQPFDIFNWNYKAIICHELAHALGVIHEQCRSDRDTYVIINSANIIPGTESNFAIVPGSLNKGSYDYDSVMHYGRNDFSTDPNKDTIQPVAANFSAWINKIGQRDHLSEGDKNGMAIIYGAPGQSALPTVTITTPADGSSLSSWTSATGTVAAQQGKTLLGFGIFIIRDSDSSYWNGNSWNTTLTSLTPAVTNDGKWTLNQANIPSGANLAEGEYTLVASALDSENGETDVMSTFHIDRTVPLTLTLTTPANNASISTTGLTAVQGAVADNANGSGILKVEFVLKRDSDSKYWTGTAWGARTLLSSTVTGGNWARTTSLPSGTNLVAGSYTLAAYGYDKARNLKTVTSTFKVTSNTPLPQVSITTPKKGIFINEMPQIVGRAIDNSGTGIARVDLVLKRNSDSKYWTGTAWGARTILTTTYTAATDTWLRATGLPTGANLVQGQYTAAATAYDNTGNAKGVTRIIDLDLSLPVITITNPANNATVTALNAVSGTVTDAGGSGVDRVELIIKRNSDGKYWTGTAWGARTLLATTRTGANWTRNTGMPTGANLTNGSYTVGATAYDMARNLKALNVNVTVNTGAGDPVAPAASPLGISTVTASANSITLNFTGALDANAATEPGRYSVMVAGRGIAIESVALKGSTSVVIGLADGSLASGDDAAVTYNLLDARGRTLKGQATTSVR